MDLASAAESLYGGPLADFVATRTALAKRARGDGNRDLAKAIGALRKPTTAAWVVNTTMRGRESVVDEVLGLGDELRVAQRSMDGQRMRELGARASGVIAAAMTAAIEAAGEHGQSLSDSVATDVEQTLRAAMADEGAAAAVRTGRLVAALPPSGLAGLDLTAVVDTIGAPTTAARPRRVPQRRADAADAPPDAATAAKARAEQTRKADARAAAAARKALATASARVTELEAALRVANARAKAARTELRAAEAAEATAERELAAAKRTLDTARAATAPPSRRGESNP